MFLTSRATAKTAQFDNYTGHESNVLSQKGIVLKGLMQTFFLKERKQCFLNETNQGLQWILESTFSPEYTGTKYKFVFTRRDLFQPFYILNCTKKTCMYVTKYMIYYSYAVLQNNIEPKMTWIIPVWSCFLYLPQLWQSQYDFFIFILKKLHLFF